MSEYKIGIMYRFDDLRTSGIDGIDFAIVEIKVHRILKLRIEISRPKAKNPQARDIITSVRKDDKLANLHNSPLEAIRSRQYAQTKALEWAKSSVERCQADLNETTYFYKKWLGKTRCDICGLKLSIHNGALCE